jgi:hypothetical protein
LVSPSLSTLNLLHGKGLLVIDFISPGGHAAICLHVLHCLPQQLVRDLLGSNFVNVAVIFCFEFVLQRLIVQSVLSKVGCLFAELVEALALQLGE